MTKIDAARILETSGGQTLFQLQYLSFNSDYQAYPFGAWPKGEPKSTRAVEQSDA